MDSQKKQSVALTSVFASLLLTTLKLVVGLLTGSIGIISEAAHSGLDFGAALLTYFAVRIGDKPPDDRHPYGHGKVESISAFIETGLLFLTSAWIIYEAIQRLMYHTVEIETRWYAFAVIIISILIDFSRSRALSKVAVATKSQALEADALHFSSDILSSFVVLIGLIFVAFGVTRADAFAAIGVSFFVLHAGYSLGKRTIDVLVDTAPKGLVEQIGDITKKIKGVISIEKIRVRPVGITIFVDMTISVSRMLPLEKTHEICQTIERNIHQAIPETDITIHTKPLSLDSETIIEQVKIIAANHNLSTHDIVVHTQNNKKYVSFDLEVNANLDIEKAHSKASRLEKEIKKEIGNDTELNIHIEPLKSEILLGKNVGTSKNKKIRDVIETITKKLKLVKNVHDIEIRKSNNKYFITLHCVLKNNTPLEIAHAIASKYEYLIKDQLSVVERVVIHTEPLSDND